MGNFIYKTILIFVLFFGYNVMCFFGIDSNPVYVALLIICFVLIFYTKSEANNNKLVLFSAIAIVCFGLYKTWTDTSDGSRFMSLMIMLPIVVYGALPYYHKRNVTLWKEIESILIIAFLTEVGLSIFERIIMYNIFPHSLSDLGNITGVGISQYNQIVNNINDNKIVDQEDLIVFRSWGLHGHPLQNALIVTTIMTFILFSQMKLKKKLLLWFLGFIAVLCFNARFSIVVNIIVFFIFLIYTSSSDKDKTERKISLLFFTTIIFSTILYLMDSQSYGGRLAAMGLLDEHSAQVRIDTWNIFNNYTLMDFLFGHNYTEINQIFLVSDITATENFWIDWLLRFGLIFLILYIVAYYYILKRLYINYQFPVSIITFISFIATASINNSLSVSWMPTFIYLLCIKIFDPAKKITLE